MTPTLDRFLYQWTIYKRSLLFFFTINVFAVVVALVLGINYFTLKRNLGNQQLASLEQLENVDVAQDLLTNFENESIARGHLQIRTRDDENKVLALLERKEKIKSMLVKFQTLKLSDEFLSLVATPNSQKDLAEAKKQLAEIRTSELHTMKGRLEKYNDTTRLLIWTGVLTLLFGLILPSVVLYLMGRTLNYIRRELQNAALNFIRAWAETKAGFGDEAFKNVDFWLQILLLAGQQAGQMSRHPVAQVSSELAYLIRIELQKKSTDKSAA